MYARARHGVQRKKCGAIAPAVKPAPGGARLARPKAVDVAAAAVCMVAPARARRPRGGDAYRSFRRLGGRDSPLQEQCRNSLSAGGCWITKVAKDSECREVQSRESAAAAGGGVHPTRPRPRSKLLAAQHAPAIIKELVRLATKAKNEATRVAAGKELLDRAFGKPPQALVGDPTKPLSCSAGCGRPHHRWPT